MMSLIASIASCIVFILFLQIGVRLIKALFYAFMLTIYGLLISAFIGGFIGLILKDLGLQTSPAPTMYVVAKIGAIVGGVVGFIFSLYEDFDT
jgi:heme/copper-type cytochrome/quinol oxidase subunit 1